MKSTSDKLAQRWRQADAEWREPAQIASQWREASAFDSHLLDYRVSGSWWDLLQQLGITLFVTREYEHLAIALSVQRGRPHVTFHSVPHPSGLVVDRNARRLFLASTRNPNQIYVMKPASASPGSHLPLTTPFVPVRSAFYPGSLYLHDLALIGGALHGNAVGHNAVVRFHEDGRFQNVWWPKSIERGSRPAFERNYIQLNSIAAGSSPRSSFYSASSSRIGRLRPGHLRYKVDRQGVVISGRTREPICTGLTRPHSARLWNRKIWVANSGYGELGYVSGGRLEVVRRFSGWTRGLCLTKDFAFVATSRVIPRFARYAPGLRCDESRCGVHAVCLKTGEVCAALEWPYGNQVFAIDWIDSSVSPGFFFERGRRSKQEIAFFYRYLIQENSGAE